MGSIHCPINDAAIVRMHVLSVVLAEGGSVQDATSRAAASAMLGMRD